MRHIEQTRRVAVDNPIPDVSLAANRRTGSACACFHAYSMHDIDSFLLPPATPRVDSSATHPSRDQPCSTPSHNHCWPPAGHTAVSPPRLHTTLTGAPFRSTAIFVSPFPQSQSSTRFPSHPLSTYHPLHPSSQKPRSSSPFLSKSYFSASQFPLALTLWSPNFRLAMYRSSELAALCASSVYCFQSIGCERPESDVLLPSRALPRSLNHPNFPPTLAGGLPHFTRRTPPA
jgi:hypothetical protein